MTSMRAVVQEHYGAPEVLALGTRPVPEPGAHDVLVRVHAAAIHIGDAFAVRGTPWPMRAVTGWFRPTPGVPGFDLSGVVERVGPAVTRFRVGDAVFGVSKGTCAEYATAPEAQLALKPAHLTFQEAAAVPTSALAALHGLRDAGHVRAGQRVLVNGASGGIGTFAVQLARGMGAEVTAVCSASSAPLARALGAHHVLDYAREDFTQAVGQYDLIFDNVENRTVAECRRALTPTGTLVLNSGTGEHLLGRMLRPMLMGPFVRHRLRRFLSKANQRDLELLRGLLDCRALRPVLDRVIPINGVAAGLRYLETGRAKGKVVVAVGPGPT